LQEPTSELQLCEERMVVCMSTLSTHPSIPHEGKDTKSIRQLLEEEISWLTERKHQLRERLVNLTQESEAFITNLERLKIQ